MVVLRDARFKWALAISYQEGQNHRGFRG